MKKGRIALIIAAVVVVLIAAAIIFVLTNLDRIVKVAIERYGSEAARTAVRVESVKIRLTSGEGAIAGVTVANPRGFTTPHAFSLGKISTRIDTGTITKSPVVIDEIRISAPRIVYEMNQSGASNIGLLKKNIQRSAGTSKKKSTEKKASGKEPRLRIKKFIIESGRIDVRIPALGDRPRKATLSRLVLRDIGGPKGATPSEIASQVMGILVDETVRTVGKKSAERYLEKGIDRTLKKLFGN